MHNQKGAEGVSDVLNRCEGHFFYKGAGEPAQRRPIVTAPGLAELDTVQSHVRVRGLRERE